MTEKDKLAKKGSPEKKEMDKYFKIGLTAFGTVAACIIFFFAIFRIEEIMEFIGNILKAAEPVIIGLVLAYLLMPVKNYIEKPAYKLLQKTRLKEKQKKDFARGISITGAIIFLFVVLAFLASIIVPALASSIMGLIDKMPKYVASFISWLEEVGITDTSIAVMIGDYITELTSDVEQWAKNEMIPLVQQYIGTITSGVYSVLKTFLNFIVGIFVVIYVMSIQETLVGQAKKIIYAFFSPKKGNLIIDTLRKSNKIFGGFIIGKLVGSAIIGVICYIGCLILGIPSSLLVAVIVGITNVIPFFGPFIGAIPSVLLVLIQSPIHGLYLAIFILILQQIEGNIIEPKILGDTTGLSSFWVLFSILIAGGLFGFFGLLFGVPIFAVIYYICQQMIKYRMEKRNLSNDTEDYVKLISIDENDKTMIYENAVEENEEK